LLISDKAQLQRSNTFACNCTLDRFYTALVVGRLYIHYNNGYMCKTGKNSAPWLRYLRLPRRRKKQVLS